MDREARFQLNNQIIMVSFWINAILMILKFVAGYFGHSSAVLADGVESAGDFIILLCSGIALRIGNRPYDYQHPYGHGKAEGIAALFSALFIFASGIGLLINIGVSFSTITRQPPHILAVLMAAVTIVVKEILYRITQRIAQKTGSIAVSALALDHHKDALTSVVTLAGAAGAYAGWTICDPLAAIFTSLFIFRLALTTARQATHELMDEQPPRGFLTAVSELSSSVPGVHKVHEIRARNSGQSIIIDLKLEMDPRMTVKEAHDIAHQVKRLIFDHFDNVGDVMIHINPAEEPHEDMIRL